MPMVGPYLPGPAWAGLPRRPLVLSMLKNPIDPDSDVLMRLVFHFKTPVELREADGALAPLRSRTVF